MTFIGELNELDNKLFKVHWLDGIVVGWICLNVVLYNTSEKKSKKESKSKVN